MNTYLQQRTLYPPLIRSKPSPALGLVVTIPAYDEEELLLCLRSLQACSLPDCDVEVIALINHAESAPEELCAKSRKQYEDLSRWALDASKGSLHFRILYRPDLPERYAGVGLARKILMDEACFRFARAGCEDGVIACLDADSRVEKNYLEELCRYFSANTDLDACAIRFAHPLEGADWPEEVYRAIAQYELHLRVYLQWQCWSGFPFAFHTVGSSMAVRSSAYQKQGGMNKRQAGEDFYFLQKFIETGRVGNLQTTCVCPSPRPSQRVPFGTGRAIGQMLRSKGEWPTYSPESFAVLRDFYAKVSQMYAMRAESVEKSLHPVLRTFLQQQDWRAAFRQIKDNVASPEAFSKRFFRWFNAFRQMKFLHHAREVAFPDVPVAESARMLFAALGISFSGDFTDFKQVLRVLRERERMMNGTQSCISRSEMQD